LIAVLSALPAAILAQSPTPVPSVAVTPVSPEAAADDRDELVEEILATMSVADRVGQLFLITFDGDDVGFDSDIAELIYGYRVGGVVLNPGNRNYSNEKGVDTPREVASLANRLQGLAYGVLLPTEDALQGVPDEWPSGSGFLLEDMTGVPPVNLPLFVGAKQLGDNLPEATLRRGFTPLPSQMAIGAAWEPELAKEIGRITGAELQAVGVNLLLGPNLDVLAHPQPEPVGRLGVHMFGGDPYWVGRLGQAYIAGVHEGSDYRMATVVGHFPGAGDVDRLPEEEVSTVQRPLAELQRIALPPFQAVTGQNSRVATGDGDAGVTDGMMSSHARYSAYQGSSLGRNTPIGLAPQLGTVLEQEGFGDWRAQGGILVSGELGVPAIRRHYALSPAEFPFRRIALDAFTAGHDLLYLGRFSSDDVWESERLNIKETIGFFQERYVNDSDFAQAVDGRVRRILQLKLRLYGVEGKASGIAADAPMGTMISLDSVLVEESDLDSLEEGRSAALAVAAQVARQSTSILYPDPRQANEVLSRVPQAGEQILVFTDSRLQLECEDCTAEAAVGPDEIENIILRLYGPGATDQLAGDEITSLTFADLEELLDAEAQPGMMPVVIPTVTPAPTQEAQPGPTTSEQEEVVPVAPAPPAEAVEDDGLDKNSKTRNHIKSADWIIFAMLDVDADMHPHSGALKRFLRQYSDDLASKYVAVFALNAPYFLDATEISKLNVYYGVYSKTQPFLEGAVRALFRSYTPDGAPPVSVVGTRFSSLAERLSPDPDRIVALRMSGADGLVLATETRVEQGTAPAIDTGAVLQLEAGPILDRNGNVVGDGKIVEFVLTFDGDQSAQRVDRAPTRAGMAVKEVLLDRSGLMQVVARVGEATSGDPLEISVEGEAAAESGPTIEVAPALVEAPGETAEAVAMSERDAAPAVSLLPSEAIEVEDVAPINVASLVIALSTIMIMVSMLLIVQVRILPRRTLVHSILWAINCGLAAYILYGFGLVPGASWLQTSLKIWGAAIVVFVAMLLPLLWLQLRPE
jgi:beta-N-acetylhexosaminidase